MKQTALKIFKSKYFIWPVTSVSIVVASIFVCFVSIKEMIIFPDLDGYKFEYYTDKANRGNSEVLEYFVSDSVIKIKFLLKNAFHSPYVGLSTTPLANKFINAGKYNQLSLKILGLNIERVGITILTLPITSDESGYHDETFYHSYLNISSQKKTYDIPIEQFQHPEWWKDLHHITESKENKPDLDHIFHINIGSAYSPVIDNEKTLEIYSIEFTRNNQKLFLILGFIYVISVLLLFGIFYLIAFRKSETSKISVSYIPLEVTDRISGVEKCIEFINNNYSNSNLTLKLISKETGVTPRRITNIIHDKYDCNFKTYINRIRINESKRLLTRADLNIGEIAYKVGFNNQSHFNRVFKSELNISPSEYRENKKI